VEALFLGGTLVIKTGQQSLKHMMTQHITEGIQHKLLMKLLEFQYTIEYKKGKENTIADALSRKDSSISAITSVTPTWITGIEQSYASYPYYTSLI
jgi:hypothetical protein